MRFKLTWLVLSSTTARSVLVEAEVVLAEGGTGGTGGQGSYSTYGLRFMDKLAQLVLVVVE